ncbi:hypothetical protein DFH29DRAFT_984938 [Suillus ampliporus]|nr:hypothetical protein DFH29DRAFT_984938 [Suillus ampliporus]
MPTQNNPNNAIRPDFTTGEYTNARARLIDKGIADDALAAEALDTIWTLNNEAAKDTWAEQEEDEQRQAQEARRHAAKLDQERQRTLEDELTAARKEELKKNKAKFVPVSNAKIPTIPVVIPSSYAVWKLKAGEYCELGLNEAKKNLLSTEPQGMILLLRTDGQQIWAIITKDENLSWEDFNEAAPRIIPFRTIVGVMLVTS